MSAEARAEAITIRPAAAADLPAVSALLARTWHATYDGIYGADRVADITARWHAPAALARGIGVRGGVFLIALQGDAIIGTASAAESCNGCVTLDRLYVDPSRQGRGIGRQLLAACLAAFPAAGSMELDVEPQNTQAIAFYERNGFVVAGRTSDCGGSGDGIPALRMRRKG